MLSKTCVSAETESACTHTLGLCNSYATSLQTDSDLLRKEVAALQAQVKDATKEPLIPKWAEFALGFLVGAVGLRLITK